MPPLPMLDPATIIEFVVFGFVFASVCICNSNASSMQGSMQTLELWVKLARTAYRYTAGEQE